MHMPGSRLGNYHTPWTFYWLSHQFSGGFNKILIRLKKCKMSRDQLIVQNHIAVFSTCFYHIFTCKYTVFARDQDHVQKLRTMHFFCKVISKIRNSGKNNYFLVFKILEIYRNWFPNASSPHVPGFSWAIQGARALMLYKLCIMIVCILKMCTSYFVHISWIFSHFWGVMNLDIFLSKMLRWCLGCIICNSNSLHSFIFKLCIMIDHTLKMCTFQFVHIW